MKNLIDALSDNLTRVKKAKSQIDDFGNIGASHLLSKARTIYSELEVLEELIQKEIRKEESYADA